MRSLQLAWPGDRLSVLCFGAQSDDIEIGAGATLPDLQERGVRLEVHWCVLSRDAERERQARASAADFLAAAQSAHIEVMSFKDGFFPEQGEASSHGSSRSRNAPIPTSFRALTADFNLTLTRPGRTTSQEKPT